MNGSSDLKNHIWFRDFDWKAFSGKLLKPPFNPEDGDENYDYDKV